MINRRGLITGLISFAAAPAIVKYSSLMPIKVMEEEMSVNIWFDAQAANNFIGELRRYYIQFVDSSLYYEVIPDESFYL